MKSCASSRFLYNNDWFNGVDYFSPQKNMNEDIELEKETKLKLTHEAIGIEKEIELMDGMMRAQFRYWHDTSLRMGRLSDFAEQTGDEESFVHYVELRDIAHVN